MNQLINIEHKDAGIFDGLVPRGPLYLMMMTMMMGMMMVMSMRILIKMSYHAFSLFPSSSLHLQFHGGSSHLRLPWRPL